MPTTLNNVVNAIGKDIVAKKLLRDVIFPHCTIYLSLSMQQDS